MMRSSYGFNEIQSTVSPTQKNNQKHKLRIVFECGYSFGLSFAFNSAIKMNSTVTMNRQWCKTCGLFKSTNYTRKLLLMMMMLMMMKWKR